VCVSCVRVCVCVCVVHHQLRVAGVKLYGILAAIEESLHSMVSEVDIAAAQRYVHVCARVCVCVLRGSMAWYERGRIRWRKSRMTVAGNWQALHLWTRHVKLDSLQRACLPDLRHHPPLLVVPIYKSTL